MNPILITRSDVVSYLRMDLAPTVGNEVRDLFLTSADQFEDGIDDEIKFDPGYDLQEGECFVIKNFPMDEELLAICKQPISADRLEARDLPNLHVKSVVGYDFSSKQRRLFFQNFDSRRILLPGKRIAVWATADSSTFGELKDPVVLLEANLSAIWDNGTLKFKSFHLARQIFDLSEHFNEATDDQIGDFVAHRLIACDDETKLISISSAWARKKIALILHAKLLDKMTIDSINSAAKTVGYEVPIAGGKIALPTEKKELKSLLQFLDEDIYVGPISQRRLVSSGKREM